MDSEGVRGTFRQALQEGRIAGLPAGCALPDARMGHDGELAAREAAVMNLVGGSGLPFYRRPESAINAQGERVETWRVADWVIVKAEGGLYATQRWSEFQKTHP